jgi:hypothetical protein
MITREQAMEYVSFGVDDAQAIRSIDDMPDNARLVGWQCGFEPMFVAVWSYLADTMGNHNRLEDDEAEELAIAALKEQGWFGSEEPTPPDYIL